MRLRIIAGSLGGRYIQSPETFTTHPMSERMRGALFNMLGDITGKSILDPFSGSGAISFEAISRGAESVIAIERDKKAQEIITQNAKSLQVGRGFQLIRANCRAWAETSTDQFDLIICDPPYNDIKLSTIARLCRHLKINGLMVLSHPGRESAPTVNGVVVVDNRKYGDAALAIYRLDAAAS